VHVKAEMFVDFIDDIVVWLFV